MPSALNVSCRVPLRNKTFFNQVSYKARWKAAVAPLSFYKEPVASSLTFTQVGQSFTRGRDDFNLF
jgi:hypothetical protein